MSSQIVALLMILVRRARRRILSNELRRVRPGCRWSNGASEVTSSASDFGELFRCVADDVHQMHNGADRALGMSGIGAEEMID